MIMNSYLNDIFSNAPVMIVIVTALAAMIVEATHRTKPVVTWYVSLTGLAVAALFAVANLSVEGQSFGGMVRHGGYANFFGTLFCIVAFMTVILSRNYFEQQKYHRGEFYILLLFTTVGMMLIASANDLIILFLGIELMSVCLYVLAGFIRTKDRANEAALKYFLLGAFSTGFLLYGIALIYGAVGTTNLLMIQNVFAVVSTNPIVCNRLRIINYWVGIQSSCSTVPHVGTGCVRRRTDNCNGVYVNRSESGSICGVHHSVHPHI